MGLHQLPLGLDCGLLLDLGFVNQHHWNVVFDGIDAFAFNALQTLVVRSQLNRLFAQRANQNVQQVLTDRHRYLSAVAAPQ